MVVKGLLSLPDTLRSGAALITDATAADGDTSCRIDALERHGRGAAAPYRPILLIRHEKVAAGDRLLLGFATSVLGRVQGESRRSAGSSTTRTSSRRGWS
jgi:hypothetical protein